MKVIKKIISIFKGKSASKKAKEEKKPSGGKRHEGGRGTEQKKPSQRGARNDSSAPRSRGPKSGEGERGRGPRRSGRSEDSRRGDSAEKKPSHAPRKAIAPKKILEAPSLEEVSAAVPNFAELKLGAEALAAVKDQGYEKPSDIQAKAIPVILGGKDVVGTAQTGTGKTAAFALPVVDMLKKETKQYPRVLVLSPTRELAAQSADAFEKFAAYTPFRVLLVQGGVSMSNQINHLENGVDIVVATPGRLLDLLRQRVINLKEIEYLILDEVDRMFDMGFIEDVSNIIRYCPKKRQTLFFSATMPDAVMKLSRWALTDAETVGVGITHSPADTIEHFVYPVDKIQKYDLLLALLNHLNFDSTIVFTRTRRDADRIQSWIELNHHESVVLHSDKSQSEREQALKAFKAGKVKILVATDIASRGLDISNITYVINYNVPEQAEDYVHRIGRTGRANKEGKAITLYCSEERPFLLRIEKFIGSQIDQKKLEGFNYRNDPLFDARNAPVVKKKRNR